MAHKQEHALHPAVGALGAHAQTKVFAHLGKLKAKDAAIAAHKQELAKATFNGALGAHAQAKVFAHLGKQKQKHKIAEEEAVEHNQEQGHAQVLVAGALGVLGAVVL